MLLAAFCWQCKTLIIIIIIITTFVFIVIVMIALHGRTALMTAASEGHMSIVRLFLRQNANTELKDAQGWKASDHAVIHGHHRLGKHATLYSGVQISFTL